MYCRNCGRPVPADARFCPNCGEDQEEHGRGPKGIHSAWILLAFLLFPPLGLILMWTSSRWSEDTKWIVSGFFFTPLWMRFLWRLRWSPTVKVALLALFVAASFYAWLAFTSLGIAVWMTIVTVIALFFIVRSPGAQPRRTGGDAEAGALAATRRAVEAKLESCHDLIAEIEGNTVMDFFPLTSPARQTYVRGLETRSEAMDLYERADTAMELAAADRRAGEALDELKAAQDALWAASPEGAEPPTP